MCHLIRIGKSNHLLSAYVVPSTYIKKTSKCGLVCGMWVCAGLCREMFVFDICQGQSLTSCKPSLMTVLPVASPGGPAHCLLSDC